MIFFGNIFITCRFFFIQIQQKKFILVFKIIFQHHNGASFIRSLFGLKAPIMLFYVTIRIVTNGQFKFDWSRIRLTKTDLVAFRYRPHNICLFMDLS